MASRLAGMDVPTDVHLEADIHADNDNPQGLAFGAWLPYLTINYELTKAGSDWRAYRHFMPMTASDGPPYGANVKLDDLSRHYLSYRVLPPPYAGFFSHTDKETGVAAWCKPFTVRWDFVYVDVGEKGGY